MSISLYKPVFLILLAACFAYSCTSSKKHETTSTKDSFTDGNLEAITVNNADLLQVLDSFARLNRKYLHCTPTVGYIQIMETRANNELKLLIESYNIDSPDLEKLFFNEIVVVKNYRFFVDRNTDNYFGRKSGRNLGKILKKERMQYAEKERCGSEFTWLVHFSGKSIDTISYRATSRFEPPCMGCNEWGDISRMFVKAKDSDSLKNYPK
ncbi:hypothetical protein [Fluviicola sp.]|uniref:hypothetical protein n=1 Tax=Fluviicola sp. TaxID=1917219 RepID=UPI0031D1C540